MTHTREEHDHVICRKVELELGPGNSLHLQEPRRHHQVVSFTPSSTPVMWSRISNALNYRHTGDETGPSSPDVVSATLEKHPNLSVPHRNDDSENKPPEVSFPGLSPPSSPSRRNGLFRRMSRSVKHDSGEPSKSSSTLKLPLRLPKKVKSQLSLQTNGRCISARPCYDVHRNHHFLQLLKFPSAPFQIP